MTVVPHPDRHQDRHIAHFTRPAALEHHTVEKQIRELAVEGAVAPRLNVTIDLLLSRDTVPELTRVPQSASVMSSTRRTLTPARYISTSASSTDDSRLR